tara:strand:+ start:524 stop:1408 length:885 start_codon:yes stop_codon:yes gene_type:complete
VQNLVTIAIPTYNRAQSFLRDTITAALGQTWSNVEVIVGDNASTDMTAEVVGEFDDDRLRYVRHESNIGPNANFNHLLKIARGDWFLLFHDDDMIDEDFIEYCMAGLEPNIDCGFIRTGVRAIDGDGKILKERKNLPIGKSKEDFYLSWFRSKIGLYLCNTLYNTHKLQNIGGFHSPHNLLEDNFALARLLEKWAHIDLPEVKASYRYTYDQRTNNVPVLNWCEDFAELLEIVKFQCSKNKYEMVSIEGRRFFGQLCVRRANVIPSVRKKVIARIQVAYFFGLRTLRLPWKNRV